MKSVTGVYAEHGRRSLEVALLSAASGQRKHHGDRPAFFALVLLLCSVDMRVLPCSSFVLRAPYQRRVSCWHSSERASKFCFSPCSFALIGAAVPWAEDPNRRCGTGRPMRILSTAGAVALFASCCADSLSSLCSLLGGMASPHLHLGGFQGQRQPSRATTGVGDLLNIWLFSVTRTGVGATATGRRSQSSKTKRSSTWGMTDQRRDVWNKRFASRIKYHLQDYFARRGADVFASGPGSFVIPRSYNRLRQRRHDATADPYADCLLTSEKALSLDSDLAVPQSSTPVSSSWSDKSTSWESFNLSNTRLCTSPSGRSGYLSEEVEPKVPGGEGNEPPWSSCVEAGVLSSTPSTPPPAQFRSASTYEQGVAVPLAGEPGLGSAKHEWIADQEAGYDFAAVDNVDGFLKCCVDVADVILNQNASVAKVYVSVDGAEQAQRLAQGWLQCSRKMLRYYLSQKMRRRRRIPELFFHLVDTKGIAKMLFSLHRLEVEEVIPYELKHHRQTAKANEAVQDESSSTHSKVP
ncbi:ribosome-binding factor A [Toxoplasma gondii TgCatPRC2]|uniref:Ribosome-binding factor A n=1 Tax=Toxoplasma gondii TgCatPRC2 TaxID=1130821 RepID=A0A151H1U5_TOXGO|nr:ribosome-binding factor A [Toxoplasma gondii TgCatPRC2]